MCQGRFQWIVALLWSVHAEQREDHHFQDGGSLIIASLRSVKCYITTTASYNSLFHLHPQDFDIEVEGTRELKLHVYSKSRLNFDEHCAQGKIEVSRGAFCVRAYGCALSMIMPMHFVDGYGNHLCIIFSC